MCELAEKLEVKVAALPPPVPLSWLSLRAELPTEFRDDWSSPVY